MGRSTWYLVVDVSNGASIVAVSRPRRTRTFDLETEEQEEVKESKRREDSHPEQLAPAEHLRSIEGHYREHVEDGEEHVDAETYETQEIEGASSDEREGQKNGGHSDIRQRARKGDLPVLRLRG